MGLEQSCQHSSARRWHIITKKLPVHGRAGGIQCSGENISVDLRGCYW